MKPCASACAAGDPLHSFECREFNRHKMQLKQLKDVKVFLVKILSINLNQCEKEKMSM